MVCALPGCTSSMCLVCVAARHKCYVYPCQPAVSDINILDGRDACGDGHCRCRAMQPSLDLLICGCRRQHVGGLPLSSGQARSGVGVVAVGIRTALSGGPLRRWLLLLETMRRVWIQMQQSEALFDSSSIYAEYLIRTRSSRPRTINRLKGRWNWVLRSTTGLYELLFKNVLEFWRKWDILRFVWVFRWSLESPGTK